MAFCVECGTKLPEGARFCSNCGKAVVESTLVVEATPVIEAVPVVKATPVVEAVPVVETAPEVEEAPVVEVTTEPEKTAVVSEEDIINENVYEAFVAEPVVTEPVVAEPAVVEPVVVPEVTVESEAQSVYAEPEQTPVCVPAVSVASQYTQEAPSSTKEEQQALLDNIYARLKNERLCWKIFGFVWLGYAALFTVLAFAAFPIILYNLLFVPFAIISFKMIGKVDYYMNTLYTDCTPTVDRCGSVGMIVFGAFFNTVAMIFIIINFVNVKSNEKTLRDIKRNQDAYNNRF